MNKNHVVVYGAILPLILLVGLVFGAGYLIDKDKLRILGLGDNGRLEVRRFENFPAVIPNDDIIEKQRQIITTQEELDTFLKLIDPTGLVKINETVNFDKEMLIGVTTKTLSTTGYSMKINRIYVDKEDNSLLVSNKQTKPGDLCEVESQPNIAVDMVAINKTDQTIAFEVVKELDECN